MQAQSPQVAVAVRRDATLILSALGVVLLAANMRAPITAVGPLVPVIQRSLDLSNTAAGALTTVPLLAFALLSPPAARLARALGIERVLFFSLLLLLAGHLVRPLGGVQPLFAGTILIGAAIALANVLMPALVKERFGNRLGIMTGVYTVAMNFGAALAAGFSIPLAERGGLGWRGSLRFWALLTLVALVAWVPQLRYRGGPALPPASGRHGRPLWRSPLAWQVTFFMGLQSFLFYCVIAWFPVILQQKGVEPETAGWMISVFQFAQLPAMFFVPIQAERMRDQKPLVFMIAALMAAGIGGYLLPGSSLAWPASVALGVGAGSALPLAMMFFTLRTRDAMEAARLSAMAQSLGYLLAGLGPPVFGWLYDVTGGWVAPLSMLLVVCACLLLAGAGAARNEHV